MVADSLSIPAKIFIRCLQISLLNVFWVPQQASFAINRKMYCVNHEDIDIPNPELNAQLLPSRDGILMSLIAHNSQGKMVVWFGFCMILLYSFWCDFHAPLLRLRGFLIFYPLIVSQMRKENTCRDIRMIQFAADTARINNVFEAQNVGVMIGVSYVQYSGSYGDNLLGTSITHYLLVDKYTTVSLAVAHIDLHYLSEQYNDKTTNEIKCK